MPLPDITDIKYHTGVFKTTAQFYTEGRKT